MEYATVKDVNDFLLLPDDPPRELEGDLNGTRVNMGSKVRHFYAGAVVRIYDDASPLGENGTVLSVNGTAVILQSTPSGNYSVSRNAEMQNQCHFTPMTKPSNSEVESLIDDNEDIVDEELHTTFRQNGTLSTEYITPGLRGRFSYPHLSEPLRYGFDTINPIFFRHSPILPMDPSKGDELRVMTGQNSWPNVLEKDSGYLIWDDDGDTVVEEQSVNGTSNFTNPSFRLAAPMHYDITMVSGTGSLAINGTGYDGVRRSENITLTNGRTETASTYAYSSVSTITVVGTAKVEIDTRPYVSRQSDIYDFWIDNQHAIACSKKNILHQHRSVRVRYRKGYYSQLRGVPRYAKRMCVLLTAIDLLENERYALNLPGGEGEGSYIKITTVVSNWKKRYRQILEKKREFVGGAIYE